MKLISLSLKSLPQHKSLHTVRDGQTATRIGSLKVIQLHCVIATKSIGLQNTSFRFVSNLQCTRLTTLCRPCMKYPATGNTYSMLMTESDWKSETVSREIRLFVSSLSQQKHKKTQWRIWVCLLVFS